MAITIHLPAQVLQRVDLRARRLGLTRSRYICETLEQDLQRQGGWPEGFIDALRDVSDEEVHAVDSMVKHLARRRSRKPAPEL